MARISSVLIATHRRRTRSSGFRLRSGQLGREMSNSPSRTRPRAPHDALPILHRADGVLALAFEETPVHAREPDRVRAELLEPLDDAQVELAARHRERIERGRVREARHVTRLARDEAGRDSELLG